MIQTKILVAGRHDEIMATLLRIINKKEQWSATGSVYDHEIISLCEKEHFDLVLFSSGIADEDERKLRSYFEINHPAMNIIQHYGGGSGLLTGEILQALGNI